MNLNATFLAQMIVFFILWWVVARYMWPPLRRVLDERAQKISEGLAAAERSKADLLQLSTKIKEEKEKARQESQEYVERVKQEVQAQADQLLQQAKLDARQFKAKAQAEIKLQMTQAEADLRSQTVQLACQIAEEILRKEVDSTQHRQLLEQYKTPGIGP